MRKMEFVGAPSETLPATSSGHLVCRAQAALP